MSMSAKIETITPNIAQDMLEKSAKNRFLSDQMSQYYASTMSDGEWQENGETIKFADYKSEEKLIDGQHRLRAIVISKTTQRMLVVRGLHEKNIQTIDIGKKRSNAGMLEINGYKNKLNLAAAASICLDFHTGEFRQKKIRKTPTAILNYVEKNNRLALIVNNDIRYFMDKKIRSIITTSLFCALHHQFSIVNRAEADLFIDDFLKTDNQDKRSAAKVFRDKLTVMARNVQRERGNAWRREIIAYAAHAFNAYIDGKKMDRLPEYDAAKPVFIHRIRAKAA